MNDWASSHAAQLVASPMKRDFLMVCSSSCRPSSSVINGSFFEAVAWVIVEPERRDRAPAPRRMHRAEHEDGRISARENNNALGKATRGKAIIDKVRIILVVLTRLVCRYHNMSWTNQAFQVALGATRAIGRSPAIVVMRYGGWLGLWTTCMYGGVERRVVLEFGGNGGGGGFRSYEYHGTSRPTT